MTFKDRDSALEVLHGTERVLTRAQAAALPQIAALAAKASPTFEEPEMVIPKTLGPGDDDGKDRGAPAAIGKPPGPGDDDPNGIDRGQAAPVRGPLGPGEADPNDKVDRNFRMLAQPAPGPGDTFVARRLTVFPNKE